MFSMSLFQLYWTALVTIMTRSYVLHSLIYKIRNIQHVSIQRVKALSAQSASWKQWESALTSAVNKARSGLAFMCFAVLNESWIQEMRFDALCHDRNTCMVRKDNSNFIAKGLSHFGPGNSCMRKRLHVLCDMCVHKALYGNVLIDSAHSGRLQ